MTIVQAMRITLGTTVAAAGIILAGCGTASAVNDQPGCQVVSTSTSTQTQAGPNHTIRHRTVTVTKQRCRGQLETSTSYSAWR